MVSQHAPPSEAIEIPPLTGIYAEPFSLSKLLRMIGFFGPAAVVASLSLGAGETIMVTGLGAWSEYGLLWLLLLSGLLGISTSEIDDLVASGITGDVPNPDA